ncbi:Glucokinase [compost metagenome]
MHNRPSMISDLIDSDSEVISAKQVFEAARQGDPVAVEVFDRTIHYMALGIANAVHTFNPDRIVIGGGVSKVGSQLFDALRVQTDKLVMKPYRGTYEIVSADLKDDVGLIGAAALFHTSE